jgi:hypothetical protein
VGNPVDHFGIVGVQRKPRQGLCTSKLVVETYAFALVLPDQPGGTCLLGGPVLRCCEARQQAGDEAESQKDCGRLTNKLISVLTW